MTPEQVKALRESATNIIAHEKQLEGQRTKLYDELEKVSTNARKAVMMAEEASRSGEVEQATRFNESAEILSQSIVSIDTQIASIDIELIEARQASDEAKSIASDSAIHMTQMRTKGAELRAEFQRAKMAESSLETTGTPSFEDISDKIGNRVAQAEALAELAEVEGNADLSGATAMIEQAALEAKAAARLAEIRSQMGVATPTIDSASVVESPDSGPNIEADESTDGADQTPPTGTP